MKAKVPPATPELRVGFGYDIHRLISGRKLILGGVHIPHPTGLLGHSDADVLLHAICDALLGAAALGDIGTHFPDSDKRYKNISSITLLQRVGALLRKNDFEITNIDSTVILEAPKINPLVPRMKRLLARALGIRATRISIKATTNEGVGPLGSEEACAAFAVAALTSRSRA
ncbi:MAG TPA: 2-C-methyl-D-erythritol 2,4-cyclodiphosphate synthase [Bacteroidota bacterium]